eukprot:gene2201-2714_t
MTNRPTGNEYTIRDFINRDSSFIINSILGGSSAAVSKTITAPLERVKLLIQNQIANPQIQPQLRYKGPIDCLVRVSKEQGNFTSVIRNSPSQALNFAFNDVFKRFFVRWTPNEDKVKFVISNFISGGVTGATVLMFVYPLDFARTRLATDVGVGVNREFKGLGNCINSIFKKEGIRGLYRGFAVSITGIFFYRAIFFGGYNSAKSLISNDPKNTSLLQMSIISLLTNGSTLITYPLDTIRRRLMMQSGNKVIYSSSWDCAKSIYANEGAYGFFKGGLTNTIKGAGAALVLVIYDEFSRIIGTEYSRSE